MDKELAGLCAEGFSFFGITNRLISHKLRNKLAVISETSGLLNDIVEFSANKGTLDPAKLKSLTESIIEEISLANGLVGRMNAFAHSVDEFITEVDVAEVLGLVVDIARLDTYGQNVKLTFEEGESFEAFTSPFFLGNLIYRAVVFSLKALGAEGEIVTSIQPDDRGIRVNFSGLPPNSAEQFTTEEIASLSKALSAEILSNSTGGELDIILPQRIGEGIMQSLCLDE
jgi:hypothetical protein